MTYRHSLSAVLENKTAVGMLFQVMLFSICYGICFWLVRNSNIALFQQLQDLAHDYNWLMPHGDAQAALQTRFVWGWAALLIATPVYLSAFAAYLLQRTERFMRVFAVFWILITLCLLILQLWIGALFAACIAAMQLVLGYRYQLRRRVALAFMVAAAISVATVSTANTRVLGNQLQAITMAMPLLGEKLVNAFHQTYLYSTPTVGHVAPVKFYHFDPTLHNQTQSRVRTLLALAGWHDNGDQSDYLITKDRDGQWLVNKETASNQIGLVDLLNTQYDARIGWREQLAKQIFKMILALAIAGFLLRLILLFVRLRPYEYTLKAVLFCTVTGVAVLGSYYVAYAKHAEDNAICAAVNTKYMLAQPVLMQWFWWQNDVVQNCDIATEYLDEFAVHPHLVVQHAVAEYHARQGDVPRLRQQFYDATTWSLQQYTRNLMYYDYVKRRQNLDDN